MFKVVLAFEISLLAISSLFVSFIKDGSYYGAAFSAVTFISIFVLYIFAVRDWLKR